jgi:CO dehydrogenase/acetyl-CoA synthase alpha subunit
MPQETFIEKQEESIAIHVFSVSAAMVGVCLTVIGIINIITSVKKIETRVDEILALNAIIFISSCILSYIAMKTKARPRRLLLEKIVDIIFLTGLVFMVGICIFIARNLA